MLRERMDVQTETPVRTAPDVDIDPDTQLNPDELCEQQKTRVTRRLIEILP